jgi:RNA recognition motif-containing protein
MSKRLYVGGLAWGVDDNRLRSEFEQFGEIVDVKVIRDRETGRSRGFGFVTFANPEDADKAIKGKNGSAIEGRNVTVNEAQERTGGGGGGGGGGRGGRR